MWGRILVADENQSIKEIFDQEKLGFTFDKAIIEIKISQFSYEDAYKFFTLFEENLVKVSPAAYATRAEYDRNDDKYFKLVTMLNAVAVRFIEILEGITPSAKDAEKCLNVIKASGNMIHNRLFAEKIIPHLEKIQSLSAYTYK